MFRVLSALALEGGFETKPWAHFSKVKRQVICREKVSTYQKTVFPQQEVSSAAVWGAGFLTQTNRGGSSCPSEEGFSPSVVLILHPEYDMVNIHKKKLFPETWGLMGTCLEHWKKITNSRSQFF